MNILESRVTECAVLAYPRFMTSRGRPKSAAEPPRYPNRIRELRDRLGLTQEDVATRLNMAYQTLGKLERGATRLKYDQAEKLADILQCEIPELTGDIVARTVPVVGYVGAGAEIFPIDDHEKGQGLRHVRCPAGLDPEKTLAAEVRGDSMFPISDGWLLFFSRSHEGVPFDAVGEMCVVKLADDGPTLVKHLRRGYARGRFNLISTNAPPREDVALDWATRVRAYLPPDLVEEIAA